MRKVLNTSYHSMRIILQVGQDLQKLSVIHGLPVGETMRLLGYGFQPTNVFAQNSGSEDQGSGNQTHSTSKKRKSRAKKKTSNPKDDTVEQINKNTSSKKRVASKSPDKRVLKKQRVDLEDPSALIIRVIRKDEKKRFALPFSPVRDGVKDKDGDIQKYPMGGPLGVLEGIIHDLVRSNEKGVKHLLSLYENNETIWSLVKCLGSFVASIDATVAARTFRLLEEDQVVRMLQHPFDLGLKVLETQFHWDLSHKSLSMDILSKINFRTIKRAGYFSEREKYLAELKRSRETHRKGSKTIDGVPDKDAEMVDDAN